MTQPDFKPTPLLCSYRHFYRRAVAGGFWTKQPNGKWAKDFSRERHDLFLSQFSPAERDFITEGITKPIKRNGPLRQLLSQFGDLDRKQKAALLEELGGLSTMNVEPGV